MFPLPCYTCTVFIPVKLTSTTFKLSSSEILSSESYNKDIIAKSHLPFTRDFSTTYRSAIEEVLLNAKQMVDRFYILKNFTDDIGDYMKSVLPSNIKINNSKENLKNEELDRYEKNKLATANRKWEIICKDKELKNIGMSNVDIGKELGICEDTVAKYLNVDSLPIQESHSKLDDYIPDIKEQILECKIKKEIYEYLKLKGYIGKESILYHRLKSIRAEVKKE